MTLHEAKIALMSEVGNLDSEGKVTFSSKAVAALVEIVILYLAATWESENKGSHHALQIATCNLLNLAPETVANIFQQVDWEEAYTEIEDEAEEFAKRRGIPSLTTMSKKRTNQ